MQDKMRRYRNDLATLKADLQRANELSERQELYNQNRGGAQYSNAAGMSREERLQNTNTTLDKTTQDLNNA